MRVAAIDIGLKRIGVALCLDEKIVFPQNAIIRKNRNQAAKEVDQLLSEWKIEKLIVGVPKGGSSTEEMQRRIEHFVSLLKYAGTVEYFDEYGSSYEAKELSKGVFRHKKDGRIDSLAAKIVLERYIFAKSVENS